MTKVASANICKVELTLSSMAVGVYMKDKHHSSTSMLLVMKRLLDIGMKRREWRLLLADL